MGSENGRKYTRHGPFASGRVPANAFFFNALEDFLASLPFEYPYQRYGPLGDWQGPGISASFLNHIEDALSQVRCNNPYQRYGPFFDHEWAGMAELFDHIEDFLVTLDSANLEQFDRDWIPYRMLTSPVPMFWAHRKDGRVINNPDYIEPALPPEPVQYGQALVGYELCEKASNI